MKGLYNYRVKKIVSIYDGDTITVDIDLGFNVSMNKQKLRLYGINTPEVRGEEREEGLKVRDYVRNELVGLIDIYIESYYDKSGKYGRWLATVYYRKFGEDEYINLNDSLVELGYAKEYMR
jgi:micrococcal nuclease